MERECYLCDKKNIEVIRTNLRHDIKRNVLKCRDCGLVFLEKKESNLRDYYQKEYSKLYTPVIGKQVTSAERFDIFFPLQQSRIEDVKSCLNPDMKALEIGCSSWHAPKRDTTS